MVYREPFCSGSKNLATYIDLDGVLCESGKENKTLNNAMKLRILGEIAESSGSICFDSCRIRTYNENRRQDRNVITFPFFDQNSEIFLKDIVERFNPDCKVDFRIGFLRKNKKSYVNEMEGLVRTDLADGRDVVFIGSCLNDIKAFSRITKNIGESTKGKIYGFNTGHLII